MGAGAVLMNVLLFKMATDWFSGKEMILAMSILVNTWPSESPRILGQGALALAVSWQAAFVATAVLAAVGMLVMLIVYKSAADAPMAQRVDLADSLGKRLEGPHIRVAAVGALQRSFPADRRVSSELPGRAGPLDCLGRRTDCDQHRTCHRVGPGRGHPCAALRSRGSIRLCIARWSVATMVGLIASQSPLPWIIASGLVAGLPAGIFVSLPGEILRAESRATGMGIFYTIFYAATAAAPVIGGALAKHLGSVAATLWMAVALIILLRGCACGISRTAAREHRSRIVEKAI
jgi:hypothetical protein